MGHNQGNKFEQQRDGKHTGGGRHARRSDHEGSTHLFDARGAAALQNLFKLNSAARQNSGSNQPMFHQLLGQVSHRVEEGVDHINVSSQSKTDIGRMFSLETPLPYDDPYMEAQIPGLRAWSLFVKTGLTDARVLIPRGLDRHVKLETNFPPNSYALQAHAIYQQIKSNPDLGELLLSLKVPVDWYITNEQGRRIRTGIGAAHAAALRVIREAMLADEVPDFTGFFDNDVADRLRQMANQEYPRSSPDEARLFRIAHGNMIIQEQLAAGKAALHELLAKRKEVKQKPQNQEARPNQGNHNGQPSQNQGQRHKKQKPRTPNPNLVSLNHVVPTVQPPLEQQAVAPVSDVVSAAVTPVVVPIAVDVDSALQTNSGEQLTSIVETAEAQTGNGEAVGAFISDKCSVTVTSGPWVVEESQAQAPEQSNPAGESVE